MSQNRDAPAFQEYAADMLSQLEVDPFVAEYETAEGCAADAYAQASGSRHAGGGKS